MCGIAGFIYLESAQIPDRRLLRAMSLSMRHRGPDAEGACSGDQVGLAHRRLSVIDLAGGNQPMTSADRTLSIVFNGEIYNYLELRNRLVQEGSAFRSHSDTEVILEAYRRYGLDCLPQLRGMFAFAIHDRTANLTLLARDRLGIKPLYYYRDSNRLVFASEIRALLAAGVDPGGVSADAVDFFLSVGYVPGERTMLRNIRRLPPAHYMVIRNGAATTQPYWDLQIGAPRPVRSDTEIVEEFEELLRQSIDMHLVSDVPVGAFLSGGLDSASIVALMNKTGARAKTFSIGYRDDAASNELDYAHAVARQFHTDHHEITLTPVGFLDSLNAFVEHMEEPLGDCSAVPLLQLAKYAKDHVKVALSGEGADEILGGYHLYASMPTIERLFQIARTVPASLKRLVARLAHGEKSLRYCDWLSTPASARYWSVSGDLTGSVKQRFYTDDFRVAAGQTAAEYYRQLFDRHSNGTLLQRMIYCDMQSWLPNLVLLKADKMSMAASLELRVPFLDHRLVEFCNALPDQYRVFNGQGKRLLKQVMEKYLPRNIVHRRKQGFPVPIQKWFRGPLLDFLQSVLLDPVTQARGYVVPRYVEQVINEHAAGAQDHSRRLFSLLSLELWHREFVDNRVSAAHRTVSMDATVDEPVPVAE